MTMRKTRHEEPMTAAEYRAKVMPWLSTAKQKNSTHMIVALDTATHKMFPVYVSRDTNIQTKIKSFNDNVSARAIEVYNMKMDIDAQLKQARVWNV
jgi:spore germination protein GerM